MRTVNCSHCVKVKKCEKKCVRSRLEPTGDRAPAWRRCALLHPTPMMVDPGTGVENASPNPLKRRYSLVGGKGCEHRARGLLFFYAMLMHR